MRLTTLSIVACLGLATSALAQNAATPKQNGVYHANTTANAGTPNTSTVPVLKPADAAAVDAWTQANKISENQIQLGLSMNGNWKTTSTVWMTPDAPAASSEGTAHFTSTMGGRFVEGTVDTKLFGLPYKGKQWFGFNNATKQFESVWIDSESTGIVTVNGTRDANGNIIWNGTTTNPVTGSKQAFKAKTSFPEKGKMTFEMWDTTSDGREFRSLEVQYVRADGAPTIKTSMKHNGNTPNTSNTTSDGKPAWMAEAAEARKRKLAAQNESHTPEVTPSTMSH